MRDFRPPKSVDSLNKSLPAPPERGGVPRRTNRRWYGMRMRVFIFLSILTAITVSSFAESPPSSASRVENSHAKGVPSYNPLLTEELVNQWLTVWQKRLGLQEWTVEARIVRIWQLPRGTVANIHWSLPKRKAQIKVLNSVDSALPRSEVIRDTELSVVHELVHLSLAKLPLDPNHTEQEEETVRKLSAALLTAAAR